MTITARTIKTFRKGKNLSRKEFGEKIGYSKASIKAWEQGYSISVRAKIMLTTFMKNGK